MFSEARDHLLYRERGKRFQWVEKSPDSQRDSPIEGDNIHTNIDCKHRMAVHCRISGTQIAIGVVFIQFKLGGYNII